MFYVLPIVDLITVTRYMMTQHPKGRARILCVTTLILIFLYILIFIWIRLPYSQRNVRETPSKQIFLPESGKKKGVFPLPKIDSGKGAFNADNSANPLKIK